jgi:hypothetical protein
MECESESVEVQWKSIKKCVLDTVSNLIRKVDRKTKKAISYTGND